ncbi:hypothetical protein II898_10980 [bacterium]|nr:hypothetical protein [bacterium]
MKIFKISALFVCMFIFLIGCENSTSMRLAIDENDEDSSEITDDSDAVDPTDAPTNPTDDPTNPTDEPTNPTDDPTNPTDEPTDPTDDPTNPTDEPTDPTDEPTNPTDEPTDPTVPTYCSAVFNGSSSKIEVAHNDALNLDSETWTIEAWFKQTGELSSEPAPIVAKKGSDNYGGFGGMGDDEESYNYFLSGYYSKTTGNWQQQQTTTAMKGSAKYSTSEMMGSQASDAEATNLSNSGEWTHIALVQTMTTNMNKTKPLITLYINGQKAASKEGGSNSNYGGQNNQTPSIATSTEPLLIGSTGETEESGFGGFGSEAAYFNGLIDSIKISNTAKYTSDSFIPEKLSADNDTIAFWDFNGNTDDSKSGFNGTPTDITYSTDCK